MSPIRVPITNYYGGGDYTAAILVGSQQIPANVILDTGSSTLAVRQGRYNPQLDTDLKATPYVQDITYGTGGWAGPLVTTKIAMGQDGNAVSTSDGSLAVTIEQEPNNFGLADGILGLAYDTLNDAYSLAQYLGQRGTNPAVSWPWPLAIRNTQSAIEQFGRVIETMPCEDVTPWFTQLVRQQAVNNKFAFYTKRSTPKCNNPQDPANLGYFILGGGEEQTDLYQDDFVNIDVVHDTYYNTNLKAIRVGDQAPVTASPLPQQFVASMVSNSIVDSGTNELALANDVFEAIMASFGAINPTLRDIALQAVQAQNNGQAIANSALQLSDWPDITFIMAGVRWFAYLDLQPPS